MIDFELQCPVAHRLVDLPDGAFAFHFNDMESGRRMEQDKHLQSPLIRQRQPITFETYSQKFEHVSRRIRYGDSFLANLTAKTEVELAGSLQDLYQVCVARYKLLWDNRILVFSPETFVQIHDNKIFSFPMKGTLDAGLPRAMERLLNDKKEMAEHVTIVDLIRNDLSRVASSVSVDRFRYVDRVKSEERELLQVSSEISGTMEPDWHSHIGDTLALLLPAGSVSGAPKARTVEIICEAEGEPRGYYTGVMGCFNGAQLDSGVMIRYIEKSNGRCYYRSGGGITAMSKAEDEYQELLHKVYIPVHAG